MNATQQWLHAQAEQGRRLYLVLDTDGQLDERNALLSGLDHSQYCNLYLDTPARSLAATGPWIFALASLEHPVVQRLLDTPERNWGWLASTSASGNLDQLTRHWRARLVTGERPHQALYRFHDNRVFARALAHLSDEQLCEYLGPMTSVCYWRGRHWAAAYNPAPGEYPVPPEPAWLAIPAPADTVAGVQFDNVRRYLMVEHTALIAELASQQDVDAWLTAQLALARTWSWQAPEQLRFLLLQRSQAPGATLPKSWLPHRDEPPAAHFQRVYDEVRFWHGDGAL